MPVQITNRQRSQLVELARKPGLWKGCPPNTVKHTRPRDEDLEYFLEMGLIWWRRDGYEITAVGRAALQMEGK